MNDSNIGGNYDFDDDDDRDDPALTADELALVNSLTDEELRNIDAVIVQNVKRDYRKVAMVVGLAIMGNKKHIKGVKDIFYAERVRLMVEQGTLESVGNLRRMRYSEVRLPQSTDDS
ncbi:DUF3658 domain-containing protein [Paraburkholderia sp. SIMBA_030]|uniref:DUF3658 domain-containing protein n=1 Tax=Paraburkholderia sp. SIMBA_030 TaxID=3085773 RepID=UPI003978B861